MKVGKKFINDFCTTDISKSQYNSYFLNEEMLSAIRPQRLLSNTEII